MRLILASVLVTFTLAAQEDAIHRLEAIVAKNPRDMGATIDLLQRYAGQVDNPDAIEARRRHVLRLIEQDPEARALSLPPSTLDPHADPEGYAAAAILWRRQTAKSDASAKTIANASFFFRLTDRATAFALVESASKQHPGDPDLARARGILDAVAIANSNPASPEALKARAEIEASTDSNFLAAAGESIMREPVRGSEDPLALAERWLGRANSTELLITVYQRESSSALDPREKARHLNQALQIAETDTQRIRILPDLSNSEFEAGDDAARPSGMRAGSSIWPRASPKRWAIPRRFDPQRPHRAGPRCPGSGRPRGGHRAAYGVRSN